MSDGTHIAFIGGRGVGKTSLARQLQAVAGGKSDILQRLDIQHDDPLDLLPIYIACGHETKDLSGLLRQLLTSDQCLRGWAYEVPRSKKLIEAYAPKFDVGIVSLGGKKATETHSEMAGPTHSLCLGSAEIGLEVG